MSIALAATAVAVVVTRARAVLVRGALGGFVVDLDRVLAVDMRAWRLSRVFGDVAGLLCSVFSGVGGFRSRLGRLGRLGRCAVGLLSRVFRRVGCLTRRRSRSRRLLGSQLRGLLRLLRRCRSRSRSHCVGSSLLLRGYLGGIL